MKVCFLISQIYQLGGAERLAYEAAIALSRTGHHDSIMVCSLYSSHCANEMININRLHEVGVEYTSLNSGRKYSDIVKSSLLLRSKLKRNNIDILEVSTLSPMLVGLFSTLLFSNVKVVLGVHQVYLRGRESTYKHAFLRFLLLFHRNRHNYYISNYVKNSWLKYNFLETSINSKVIYNSISDGYFYSNRKKQGSSDKVVLAYMGRLAAYKRIDIVYEAFKELSKHRNNIELLFIGGVDSSIRGTDEMLAYIENDINVNDEYNVRFTGFVDTIQYLKEVDILIHPTEIEGFGLSLVEALASGCYVISSDVEAIPEIIGDSRSSILNNPTPESISKEVLLYIDHSEEDKLNIQEYNKIFAVRYREEVRVQALREFFMSVA